MKKIVSLSLLLFAPFLSANSITFSSPQQPSIPEQVDIGSLNNYHSTLSRKDIVRYQPILAYQQDHHYIKVRNKGPYWVIYHAQMVWQVNEMKIKQK